MDDASKKKPMDEKAREAQPYGVPTAEDLTHNYQAANATDPEQLAQMAEENLRKQKEKQAEDDDFRQHDAGG